MELELSRQQYADDYERELESLPGFEQQYVNSLKRILARGVKTENRTGTDTYAVQSQYFLLKNIELNFPMLRGKMVYPKLALKELCWMLNGRTDVKWLEDRGVTYWNEWADTHGSIGKSYGYQYRNFNGIDNLQQFIDLLVKTPNSRRIILDIWNPKDLKEMSLPPCVFMYQLSCTPQNTQLLGKNRFVVDMHVTQRSADSFLGVPYDFMFVGWMLMIICELANHLSNGENTYVVGDIHYTCNDYHAYENHIPQICQYIEEFEFDPNGIINKGQLSVTVPYVGKMPNIKNIDDYLKVIDDRKYKDFVVAKSWSKEQEPLIIKADIAI